jgi:hypothetical protein
VQGYALNMNILRLLKHAINFITKTQENVIVNIINTLRQKQWIIIFVIYLRYLIGGAMVFSSIVKIKGERFTSQDGINEPIHSAWYLFETLFQSGIYWRFLGWSQLLAGMLLMTQFYSALGAVVLLPINLKPLASKKNLIVEAFDILVTFCQPYLSFTQTQYLCKSLKKENIQAK